MDAKPPLKAETCLVTMKWKVSRGKVLDALRLKATWEGVYCTLYKNIGARSFCLVLRFSVSSLGPAGESQHFTSLLQKEYHHIPPSPVPSKDITKNIMVWSDLPSLSLRSHEINLPPQSSPRAGQHPLTKATTHLHLISSC